jgi:hypothetical protein
MDHGVDHVVFSINHNDVTAAGVLSRTTVYLPVP